MEERLRVLSLIAETQAVCKGARNANRLMELLSRIQECDGSPIEIQNCSPSEFWETSDFYSVRLCTGDHISIDYYEIELDEYVGDTSFFLDIPGQVTLDDAGKIYRVLDVWRECLDRPTGIEPLCETVINTA